MKFSDIEPASWPELKPYFDTCLLPVTALTGSEQPWEATQRLEFLRDVLELVEIPYKGRVVTYPAFHYYAGEEDADMLNRVCRQLKQSGFKYVIVMAGSGAVARDKLTDADLYLYPESAEAWSSGAFRRTVSERIRELWNT